ncbi:MAG: 50S ribosomal protein L11 methyltransferase [Candidatus Desulfatibia sp.]|uniref:50S ribosomal protein L11 methyltransferase n=1 Tax=Candidatus Desulfatibia sp. TaxID=3101189 RepID=UPI002F3081A1
MLALAAFRLGCSKTLAVDLNFLAVNTALKNVRLNRMQDTVLVIQGLAEDFIDSPCDLVIANIHYDVMKQLVDAQGFFDKEWFILSGLLHTQAIDIAYRLSRHPFQIIKK